MLQDIYQNWIPIKVSVSHENVPELRQEVYGERTSPKLYTITTHDLETA